MSEKPKIYPYQSINRLVQRLRDDLNGGGQDFVLLFAYNGTGKTRLSMHLCFGNYKGRSVGPKSIAPMFPDFMDMTVDELHSEMTILNFSEVHLLERFA